MMALHSAVFVFCDLAFWLKYRMEEREGGL